MLLRWHNPALEMKIFLIQDCLFNSLYPFVQGHDVVSSAAGRPTEGYQTQQCSCHFQVSKPLNSRSLEARRAHPEELCLCVFPLIIQPWVSAPSHYQWQDKMGHWSQCYSHSLRPPVTGCHPQGQEVSLLLWLLLNKKLVLPCGKLSGRVSVHRPHTQHPFFQLLNSPQN